MKFSVIGCILLLYFGVSFGKTNDDSADVDYVITIIIASIAGGMVIMVLVILLVRCLCLHCKKTTVRNIRPRGPPTYDESRRVYRLPAPPPYAPYAPRDYPSHPPPAYEDHAALPGVTD